MAGNGDTAVDIAAGTAANTVVDIVADMAAGDNAENMAAEVGGMTAGSGGIAVANHFQAPENPRREAACRNTRKNLQAL